ncbi:MAG: DUF1467 family protein [Hyphomicrobiales bacterium]|nr:DUF1467 family protein [Hyphomicrobiales bacterium]
MTLGTGFAIYFLFWWLCLFTVLPFGVRSQIESGEVEPGTEPGAPITSHVWKKLLINTIVSGVVFAVYWFMTARLGFSIDQIPSPFPQD